MAWRTTVSALLRATRPLAHANIAPPILFGQALAYAVTGRFSWGALVVAQTFGVLDHLVIVLGNDYADREADRLNLSPTPFSGGSRVLPDGALAPRTIAGLAAAAALALVAFAVATASFSPLLPTLALAALATFAAYSYPPMRLSYRGGGELLQGLGVGVVLPLVGFAAQAGTIERVDASWLLPTFALGVAGNVLTSIPDEAADRAAGKRSPAARLGGARARLGSIALHLAALAMGAAWLPLTPGRALGIGAIAALPQLAAFRREGGREATLLFVVLGGATETLALAGWSLALALAG